MCSKMNDDVKRKLAEKSNQRPGDLDLMEDQGPWKEEMRAS